MADESNAQNCWAPEIFYDDASGKYLIFWSTTIDPVSNNNHRIYYVSTEDFATYTDTAMFYDPGFNCIDAFIAKTGDRYAIVLKDERDPGKNMPHHLQRQCRRPYEVPPSAPITPGGLWWKAFCSQSRQDWMLYYDAYTSGYMVGNHLKIWQTGR